MQLYSTSFSPYAARCRVQIYHKDLPVEIVAPPGGIGSAEIRASNPTGRIPVLKIDGQRWLGESWAIMEYLEDRFPAVAMRPSDTYACAQMRMLVRFADLYLASAMFPLFRALRGGVDGDTIDAAVTGLQTQLQQLEKLLEATGRSRSQPLDLADAALLPIVEYARLLGPHFGADDLFATCPGVGAWLRRVGTEAAGARVLEEMETGLRAAIPALFGSPTP